MLLVWMFVVRRACCCWWRCCCLSLCATCDCDVRLTLLWAWTLTSHNTENGERGQVRMARGERQVNIACPSLRYLSPCSYNSNNSILYINNHRWTRCICCYIFFFLFSIVTVGWSAVILILLTFTIDTNIPNKKKVSFGRMLEREREWKRISDVCWGTIADGQHVVFINKFSVNMLFFLYWDIESG